MKRWLGNKIFPYLVIYTPELVFSLYPWLIYYLKTEDGRREFKKFAWGMILGALIYFPVFYILTWILGDRYYLLSTFISYACDYRVKFVFHKKGSKDKYADVKTVKGAALCYFLLCVINTALTYYFVDHQNFSFWETQKAMIAPTSLLNLSLLWVWAKMFKH